MSLLYSQMRFSLNKCFPFSLGTFKSSFNLLIKDLILTLSVGLQGEHSMSASPFSTPVICVVLHPEYHK